MADVGTHLADLAIWFVAPDQAVDYATHIQMLAADRRPLLLSEESSGEVTRLPGYPAELDRAVVNGQLYYAGNNTATFTLRGVHVRLSTAWEYESPGGDTHQSYARGTRATVSVRQQPSGACRRCTSRRPTRRTTRTAEEAPRQVRRSCSASSPGCRWRTSATEVQVLIPRELRAGHEEHFARGDGRVRAVLPRPARDARRGSDPNALARVLHHRPRRPSRWHRRPSTAVAETSRRLVRRRGYALRHPRPATGRCGSHPAARVVGVRS